MPQDKNTAGYKMVVTFEFTAVNKYGDPLGEDSLRFVKTLQASSLTELGVVLARVDELGE